MLFSFSFRLFVFFFPLFSSTRLLLVVARQSCLKDKNRQERQVVETQSAAKKKKTLSGTCATMRDGKQRKEEKSKENELKNIYICIDVVFF